MRGSRNISRYWFKGMLRQDLEAKLTKWAQKRKSESELFFYVPYMSIEDAAQKTTNYINKNARNKVWILHYLVIRPNSEFPTQSPQKWEPRNYPFGTIVYDIHDLNTLPECDRCQ